MSLAAYFSGLRSLDEQERFVDWICRENLLDLQVNLTHHLNDDDDGDNADADDKRHRRGWRSNEQHQGGSGTEDLEDIDAPSSSPAIDEASVMEVLIHFVCLRYYDVPCASRVVRYLLSAVQEQPADRWIYLSPTSGSLIGRSVVRTLISSDALMELYTSGSLLDYLAILECIAVNDPEGFVYQLAVDECCTSDLTALQATLLIPGRLAQRISPLSLVGVRPIVEACERIAIPLLRNDSQISLFLHTHVTPSPIRTMLENLFLIPRSAKGIRLTLMVSLARVLCAATEAADPEVGRRWLEDFSLSEGPYQVYFAVTEWAQGSAASTPARQLAEELDGAGELYSIPPPPRHCSTDSPTGLTAFDPVGLVSPYQGPADPLGATAGPECEFLNGSGTRALSPSTQPPQVFDPTDPLPCAEDKLVYELLCLLVALPDDGSLYHYQLFAFLQDTAGVATYLSSPDGANGRFGSLSTLFEDRMLTSSTMRGGASTPAGLQMGMRVLIHASRATALTRPALCHFLSRVVVTMLTVRGQDIVDQGLVTAELCDVLARLVYRPPPPAPKVQRDDDDTPERDTPKDDTTHRGQHNDTWNAFTDADPEHNNEYLCYVSTVISLFAKCCRNSTSLQRQEDGGEALAKLVVEFIGSKRNLISCAAIKTVLFYAISASPQDPAAAPESTKPRGTTTGGGASSLNSRPLPPRSPNGSVAAPAKLDPLLTGGALLYNRLIHAGLAMTVASELMSDTTVTRRRSALLELLQDICARCPSLQSELIPLSTNLLLLLRAAARDPEAHVLLPRCAAILAGLRIGNYDKGHVVCHSLMGMICAVHPSDARGLVAASWALQTMAQLAARERVVQEFCRDRRHDLFQFVLSLCSELSNLWDAMEEERRAASAAANMNDSQCDEGEPDEVDLPAPGETPVKKPVFFNGKQRRLSPVDLPFSLAEGHQDTEKDVSGTPTQQSDPSEAADASRPRAAPPVDLCAELNLMFAFHRQRRDVPTHEHVVAAPLPYQYLLICDALTLSLHLTMVSHCLQQSFVADDSMSALIKGVGAGPMLKCRLYTSIVTRCLIGLSCFASTALLSEVRTVGKISMLTQPPPAASFRVTLQDLTRGWNTVDTIGDQLFEQQQHRIVRPQFVRCLLELMMEACPSPTIAGFELVVSVVELLYHVFHSRIENLYVLSMCGAWDAAVCQLVRISTANPKLRSLCVHVISNAMRLFGLQGLSSVPVNCHLLLCFDTTEESTSVVHDNVSRVFSSWEWLLNNCLPCRVPLSFFSLAFGCECSTRQQRVMNIIGGSGASANVATLKREVMLEGGVDVATAFDVWKYPVDTHMTTVLWVMIDTSSTHKGDFVLCSQHFDGNRVVVELCGDAKGTLFISVKNRKMGEIMSRRVVLGKLPTMPNKQWTMLYFTTENFASKSHASLRSKFSVKFQVGMMALHGNHHFFEAVVDTPDVDISQSLREKSLSTCTMVTHMCIGGLHRQGDVAGPTASPPMTNPNSASTLTGSANNQRRGGGSVQDDELQHTTNSFHQDPSSRSYSADAFGSPERAAPPSVSAATNTSSQSVSHQLFFASMALFQGELTAFDALVLFVLGPDALTSMDFLDKTTVINLYPILAQLATDSLRARVGPSLALLASMWLRRQEPTAQESFVPQFTGYFPFSKASRERVICILGAVQGDLTMLSRSETAMSTTAASHPTASVSDLSMALTSSAAGGQGGSLAAGSGGSHNASTLSPQSSFAPNMMHTNDLSFAMSDKQSIAATWSSGGVASTSHHKVEFLLHPKSKPIVQIPLEILFEDVTWRGGILWEDEPQFLHRPVSYTVPPIYSNFEAIGGLPMFLWLATVLDPNSAAHVLVFQCACTWLSLHYDKPMSDAWSGESSKSQDMTLLSGILHHRMPITSEIARCVTKCAGYPVLARIDFIPLLLDFSLWARDAEAMNVVTSYLSELQVSSNSFARFNVGVLRYRRVGERHDHHVLEELLLHLHMRFAGTTTSMWDVATIPSARNLIALLCTDVTALTRIVASAAWLTTEEDPACIPWTLCLLDAAIAALADGPAAVMPANPALVPSALASHLIMVLRCNHDGIRLRGLQCFVQLREQHFETVAGAVLTYEARSIISGPRRCVSSAELRILMVRSVGSERWVVPDRLRLVASAALPLHGEGMAPLTTACPMIFFMITLLPYVTEVQQLATIAFINDQFHSVPPMRRAMLTRSFCPDRGLDDPFTSLLLYALAETLERSDRSLEVGDGAAIRALVEFLVDIVTYPLTQAALHGQLSIGVDVINTVTFSILNIFVDSEDIGTRSPTPLFHCARRHILNILCACLRACELQVHTATSPAFVDGCVQLFEVVSELTTLLYIPTSSDDAPTLSSDLTQSRGGGGGDGSSTSGSTRGSQNHEAPVCEYFVRCAASSSSRSAREESPTLVVQRWYRQLHAHDRQSPMVSESADFGPAAAQKEQNRKEELAQFSKSQPEVVPLYALELSSRLHTALSAGTLPVCTQLDKHRVAHKCSLLHQQQLRLITFLLSIETRADDGQEEFPDTHLDQLQTLCLLHTYYVGPQTFAPGQSQVSTGAPSRSSSKLPKTLLKVPPNARWSEDAIHFCPESLFATAVARYKEPTIAILCSAVRFLAHIANPSRRTPRTPLILNRATLGHNICRAMLYFAKPVAFKKDLTESCAAELERVSNEYMSITSTFVDPRESQFLERLPQRLLTPHGQAALQGHTASIISRAVGRARQNLRVDSSKIPLLDPQRAVDMIRNRIDGGMQKLQASTMKRATFYEKTVDHDSRVILAVNAAYRFSLQPWWGPLATLHTDQKVALNRYELDRFTGPDWERSRLRRFAHEPKMLAGEGNAIRFQLPLASVVEQLQQHQHDRRPEDDDMDMLSLFGVTAVPQSVHQRVLMQSESASHRCQLILPMDRVPVILTLSHVGLLIRAEVPPTPRVDAAANDSAADSGMPGSTLSSATRPRGTLVRIFSNQTSSSVAASSTSSTSAAAASGYRYKHEMHDRVVPISNIRAVWPRRNLLQQVAMELLLESGDSLLLSFSTPNERKAILEKVSHYAKQYLDKTLIPNQNNLNIWRTWWSDGRISNFKYLMYLNFCAGRSYGDMRQYPVFPHIVGQYTLDALHLDDPAHFRLLDKPMGAQIPEKEARAVQLYESLAEAVEMSSDNGAGGSSLSSQMMWHYGTHYAPLACVLQSLVRVQPFGDYFLDMNSKLDEPDRVFESMANTYSNYIGANSRLSKDVREMVPEFYCLPEMLVNTNEVPFGVKQDGSVVDHVQLPPWGQNPRTFVVGLREALECPYTSERLHLWIDLVFGFKQRGRDAVAAVNVYHPLTYEKSVDLATVEDAVELKSHMTQIDNFGQTPVQLFARNSHKPRCKPNSEFHSIPSPTLRYEHAFAKSSVLLFPEKLVATGAASGASPGHAGASTTGPLSSNQNSNGGGGGGAASCWIVFCRSPIANAALGADELGDFFLSTSVVSRSVHHVLPLNVLPFTVVADTPRDYIVIRSHTVSLVDGKDLGKDLASARITKALTTVAAVQPPFAFIGSTCGAIHVVEVRFDDLVEVDVPQPNGAAGGGARPRGGLGGSSSSAPTNDAPNRWSDLPESTAGGAVDFFSTSFDMKASKVKSPQIKLVDCLYGHHGTIVSLTVANEWGILVSAAQDWVLAVWDLHRRLLIRTIPCSDLRPQRPICLFHQRILRPWGFVPAIVSVNPSRGDIVVAGLGSREEFLHNAAPSNLTPLRSEIRVFTINGELAAVAPWRTVVTALTAMGPVIFVADGRTLVVLDSVTLAKRSELHHHTLEDSIVSITVNPYGTCVAVVDKAGNVGSWKVG